MSELVIRCACLPVEKAERQDIVSDTKSGPTAEAYRRPTADYAQVESSRREQSREKAALKLGAHQSALIVGDRLSCHAVREVGVGELECTV